MIEDKKKEIEEAFLKVVESAMGMRNIELPELEGLSNEDRNEVIKMGRDLDMRTSFILRSLLTQHGNVLFL